MKEDEKNLEVFDEEITKSDVPESYASSDEAPLMEKISDVDETPEKRQMTVDLSAISGTRAKPKRTAASGEKANEAAEAMPKLDLAENAPQPSNITVVDSENFKLKPMIFISPAAEYKDMPYVTQGDEKEFYEANVSVDLSPVTKQTCVRCNKVLTPDECKDFKRKCYLCYRRDALAFRKSHMRKYFYIAVAVVILLILDSLRSVFEARGMDASALVVKVVTEIPVILVSLYLTDKILSRLGYKMGQLMYRVTMVLTVITGIFIAALVPYAYTIMCVACALYFLLIDRKTLKENDANLSRHEARLAHAKVAAAEKPADGVETETQSDTVETINADKANDANDEQAEIN